MTPIGKRKDSRARAAAAFQRRCMGQTWPTIAQALGYRDKASAYTAVRDHINRLPPEDRDHARAISTGTYDALKDQLWQTLAAAKAAGDRAGVTTAARTIADIQTRRDRLLGIEANPAAEVTVTVNDSAAAVIDRARTELLAIAAARPNRRAGCEMLTTEPGRWDLDQPDDDDAVIDAEVVD